MVLSICKGLNYVVTDTSNIALWVSVCVKNMNVKDFTCAAFVIYLYGKLIKVSSSL